MGSPHVHRHRPWWLPVLVVGGAVVALGLAVRLAVVGFEIDALSWMVFLAFGSWMYGVVWSYEVTVDDSEITVRGLLRRRSRPLSELTGVHCFGSGVALRFGRRLERVIRRGDSALPLVDDLRQRLPGLPYSSTPPPWRWGKRAGRGVTASRRAPGG